MRQDFQGLHNELLLRIGEHYQQVFNGLSILASFASSDDPYQGPRDITSPELMVRNMLYGFFAWFFSFLWLNYEIGETGVLYIFQMLEIYLNFQLGFLF